MQRRLCMLSSTVAFKLRSVGHATASAPKVSVNAIRDFLKTHRLTYKDGHASFLVKCTFCEKGDGERTVYVNKITGAAVCNSCSLNVTWKELTEWFNHQKASKTAKPVPQQQRQEVTTCGRLMGEELQRFLKEQARLWDSSSESEQQCVKMSEMQKLDPSVIKKYRIHTTLAKFPQPSGGSIQLPCIVYPWYSGLTDGSTPVRLKIETMTVPAKQQTVYEPHDGPMGLFGWNTVPTSAEEVVITGREFDAVAVHQTTGLPAISLPQGACCLPPEVLPQLERFEKIYLWLGSDAQSRQAAAQFAKKLGEKRCHIVGPTDEKQQFKSALDALNLGLDLKQIVSYARPVCHKQIVSFQQLREEVFAELYDSDRVAGVKWQRFPDLTRFLKGHRPGELTIFTGPTGSGKTTLMSELSLDLCQQGVATLWGSFEIRNVRLAKTMIKQYSGINLEVHPNQYEYWANRFQQLPLYFMGFYGAMDIVTVLETMSHAVYVHDIQHVVIDNLQFMIGTGNRLSRGFEDSFYAQNHAIAEFRKFASSKNIHVTVVIHPRKEEEDKPLTNASIFGTAKASQEADNVLILQAQPRKDKFLQVTKNRFAGDLGKVPLKYHRDSLTLSNYFATLKQQQPLGKNFSPVKTQKPQTVTTQTTGTTTPATVTFQQTQTTSKLTHPPSATASVKSAPAHHPSAPGVQTQHKTGSAPTPLSRLSGKLSTADSKLETLSSSDKKQKGPQKPMKFAQVKNLSQAKRKAAGPSPVRAENLNRAE